MKIFSVIFILLISNYVCAKQEISIGILNFKTNVQLKADFQDVIEQIVYEVFVDERRFRIIERGNLEAIDAERFIQQAKNVKELTVINDLGAKYIILGEINAVNISKKRLENRSYTYEANVIFGLKVIDVENGTVVYTEVFKPSTNLFNGIKNVFSDTSTPLSAVSVALNGYKKKLKKFVKKAFPIKATIVSIEREKKSKADIVLIAAGEGSGIEKKMKLTAFHSVKINVGGEILTRERKIAELTVLRTEGSDFSICKVKNGGAILKQLLDSGKSIFAKIK